ncbi:MAG: IS1380 family transposase [Burkholderiales bacterium]
MGDLWETVRKTLKKRPWIGKVAFVENTATNPGRPLTMKLSRKQVRCKILSVPELRFEDQQLTSFAGLFLFQLLFARVELKERLRACFRRWALERAHDPAAIVLSLILHLLLGFRQLRDSRYYRDDPMVHRVLGVRRLPDVATVSRFLAATQGDDVAELRHLCRQLVLERVRALALRRVTLDFDGSVIPTGRWAEGTAVGYNRAKKGQRSYYPLLCTVAQTGQVFDVLHRPGNVHDSNGAEAFITACVEGLQQALSGVRIEVRMDSAFFSDAIVRRLDRLGVEFTISVPFERLAELKSCVEGRRHWRRLDGEHDYFELRWKPKSWPRRNRFLVVRHRVTIRDKAPVQLDLFVPFVFGYECKVVVTNKKARAREVVRFHNGRGAQEGVLAELKSQGQLDYVPTQTLAGNQIFLLSSVLAHNLNRELQMTARPQAHTTTTKRRPLWEFDQLETLRRQLIQRAGRLTQPQGRLTLTMSANQAARNDLLHYRTALEKAA